MELNPDFTTLARNLLSQSCEQATQVFMARLLEGDTFIFLDSGEVSLVTGEELALRIRRLTNQGVANDQRVLPMGEGSVGRT